MGWDWISIAGSIFALLLLGFTLWRIDRWSAPRHHDHLIPDAPRGPRKGR